MVRLQKRNLHYFLGLMILIVSVDFILMNSGLFTEFDQVLSIGIILDFVVVIPLLIYFLIYKKINVSFLSVLPFALLGYILLGFMMPSTGQRLLDVVKYILIPIEVTFLSYLIYSIILNIRKTRRSNMEGLHPIQVLQNSLDITFKQSLMVPVLAHELAVLFYSLFSWKTKPYVRQGSLWFSYHHNSGALVMVLFVSKLLLLEGVLVHILLAQWSHTLAWIISFGNLYLILMLISEVRAMYINPILMTDKSVIIRYGNQMFADIDLDFMKSADKIMFDKLTKEKLKVSFVPLFTEPNIHIQLKDKISIIGPYGVRKKVDHIYLFLDQPEEFLRVCNKIMMR